MSKGKNPEALLPSTCNDIGDECNVAMLQCCKGKQQHMYCLVLVRHTHLILPAVWHAAVHMAG